MRFKTLSIFDKFTFASEDDPKFRTSGMARGPWIKVSARCYMHFFETPDDEHNGPYYGKMQIGSINTWVNEWPEVSE